MTKSQREVQFHSKAHRDGPQPTDEEFLMTGEEPEECCMLEEGACCEGAVPEEEGDEASEEAEEADADTVLEVE